MNGARAKMNGDLGNNSDPWGQGRERDWRDRRIVRIRNIMGRTIERRANR
jgi:hypothetical protein